MPKKIQTHLKQKNETWRCSEREAGSVQATSLLFVLFFWKEEKEDEKGEGDGCRAPEMKPCTTMGAGSPLAGFYLCHARSDGGSGDEDHVGSKLSRPEDLQRLWRRDGGTHYYAPFIGEKNNPPPISTQTGGHLISEWPQLCHFFLFIRDISCKETSAPNLSRNTVSRDVNFMKTSAPTSALGKWQDSNVPRDEE